MSEETSKLQSRYQFNAVIGNGGSGEVIAAWDKQLERTVAVKRLSISGLSEDVVRSAWQEAIRLAAIRHANIVSVYDIGMEDGAPYMVMEYVQGETLEQRVERGARFVGEEFFNIARQVLEGATAAHHAGLIHRDLKPANIMIERLPSGSAQVKILDFGLACFSQPEGTTEKKDVIAGSIHCISPEQLKREAVDARADLYAIGCVFYYALASRYPFDGTCTKEIVKAHLQHKVTHLKEHRPELPFELCEWVMKLMAREPAKRFADGREALQALEDAITATRRTTAIIHPSQLTGLIQAAQTAQPNPWWKPALAGVTAVVVAGLGYLAWQNQSRPMPVAESTPIVPAAPAFRAPAPEPKSEPKSEPKVEEPKPTPMLAAVAESKTPEPPKPAPVEPKPEVILRFQGSNTIGARLAPMLAEEFLKREGAASVELRHGKSAEESFVVGSFGGTGLRSIEIAAHGTKTAFEGLAAQSCDIGMASRAAKPEESQLAVTAGLGDLLSSNCEHVLGLDGLAILAHRENPVKALTKQQVADIFTGKVTDWSEVGGTVGPIKLHARDAKSGTFDTFKSLVLGSGDLSAGATRYEDSNALSDAVAADPQAIGFTGLPYVRQTRAVAISDEGTQPFLATRFTVAAEDYLLSRRLFLYAPASPQNPLVAKFIEFALSPEGQEVVNRAGFVKQTIDLQRPVIPTGAPSEYADAVRGAERLSLNLRFRSGSSGVDNKAVRDLDRISALLADPTHARRGLMLFGFADQQGPAASNLKVSKDRAQLIAKELESRGVKCSLVTGFGSALPMASNSDEAGRHRNRRVELWLRPTSSAPASAQR